MIGTPGPRYGSALTALDAGATAADEAGGSGLMDAGLLAWNIYQTQGVLASGLSTPTDYSAGVSAAPTSRPLLLSSAGMLGLAALALLSWRVLGGTPKRRNIEPATITLAVTGTIAAVSAIVGVVKTAYDIRSGTRAERQAAWEQTIAEINTANASAAQTGYQAAFQQTFIKRTLLGIGVVTLVIFGARAAARKRSSR